MKGVWTYKSIFALVIFAGLVFFVFRGTVARTPTDRFPELRELAGKDWSFRDLSQYFTDLANQKGAAYAYDVLKIAEIPPNIDLHLLGHVVGDILYEQRGASGIAVCTQDFRNACSHTIVIGLFYEKGEKALPEIAAACRDAPGGKGAYTMCFHGLGHGILSSVGYDMPKAIELCKKTGTPEYRNREYTECVGGTVMEIVGGGFHDRALWEEANKKFLLPDDPLLPCTAPYMPLEVRSQCYTYLTPRLFKFAGADLARPEPEHFAKAFPFCERIPARESGNRNACSGGFGKEFVVLAKDRDVRKIDQMSDKELKTVYEWCTLARDPQSVDACMNTAASSIYWGGENDPRAVIRFCSLVPDPEAQASCFTNLFGAVVHYAPDESYRKEFCGNVSLEYQAACEDRIIKR